KSFSEFDASPRQWSETTNHTSNAYAPVIDGGITYYFIRDAVPQNEGIVCSRRLDEIEGINLDNLLLDDGTRCVLGMRFRFWLCSFCTLSRTSKKRESGQNVESLHITSVYVASLDTPILACICFSAKSSSYKP
ncbi:hypothetical protein PENTCL1PPCAC_16167, partial [Pristionchus entomophagus]